MEALDRTRRRVFPVSLLDPTHRRAGRGEGDCGYGVYAARRAVDICGGSGHLTRVLAECASGRRCWRTSFSEGLAGAEVHLAGMRAGLLRRQCAVPLRAARSATRCARTPPASGRSGSSSAALAAGCRSRRARRRRDQPRTIRSRGASHGSRLAAGIGSRTAEPRIRRGGAVRGRRQGGPPSVAPGRKNPERRLGVSAVGTTHPREPRRTRCRRRAASEFRVKPLAAEADGVA